MLVILPKVRELSGASDSFPLITSCGALLGKAVLTVEECTNPVYVSVGHRLSLDTAVKLVVQCSKYRVPEPVRQVDKIFVYHRALLLFFLLLYRLTFSPGHSYKIISSL